MVKITVACWDSYGPLLREAAEKTDVELLLVTFHSLDRDVSSRDLLIDYIEGSDFTILYKSNQSYWDDIDKKIRKM